MITLEIELKRCPFCGSNDVVLCEYEDKYYKYQVFCRDCGIGTVKEHIKDIAIGAWNRRIKKG